MAPYVERWGYPLISAMIMLGNVGLPVPEETILLAGGYFASKGMLTLRALIPTAIVSATCGDSLGFVIGRRGGRRVLLRYGQAIGVTQGRIARTEEYFERYGPWTVFLARFIPGLRFMAGPLAGAFGMPFGRFLPYNLGGAVTYCSAMVSVAYVLAPELDRVMHLLAMANWAVAFAALGAALGLGVRRVWRGQHTADAG
jgi:membrane protein DedA with SNARE-associated domain